MHGFHGRLLRIDLGKRTFEFEGIEPLLRKTVLGGKALGTRLLLDESPPGVHPLDPENRIILAVGPLAGSKVWGSARFGAYSKSPATEGYLESYCGGTAAANISGCGVDAVVIVGAASAPVWVSVGADGVEFHDASPICGADAFETEERVLAASPNGASCLSIGPAGENLVAQACVKSDRWRSLGRGGLGAVFGSKRLKAISFRGAGYAARAACATPADPDALARLTRELAAAYRDDLATKTYQRYGTINMVEVNNLNASFPTRYWSSGRFEAWQSLSGAYMREHFDVESVGCPACFLHCTKRNRIREGRHAGLVVEGPEYETVYAIGGLNGLGSLEEVAWLNDLCDRLGLDTMSAGNLCAFAVEAFRRGATDFEIDYAQPDRMAKLLAMIARREGIGDILARGIRKAAAAWGLEDLAVHVKGLEPAGFDPRVLKGMGLSFATAARGACHLRGTFYKAELAGIIDRAATEGKARLMIDYEDRAALCDSLILCRFFRDFYGWEKIGALVAAITGEDMGKEKLERLANRITVESREYNRREGIGPEEDRLPPRIIDNANAEGASISPAELGTMLEDYDAIRSSRL